VNWFLLSLGTVLLWGLWAVLLKTSALDWRQALFWFAAAEMVMATGLVMTTGVRWEGGQTALAAAAGLCGIVGTALFYAALQQGKASLVVPVTALYPAVAVLLGLLLFGERLTVGQTAGIVAAGVSVFLLARG